MTEKQVEQKERTQVYSVLKKKPIDLRMGDLVLYNFHQNGEDGGKLRPAIVVSATSFNIHAEYVCLVPLYTIHGQGRERYPTHIYVPDSDIVNPTYRGDREGKSSYLAVEQSQWVQKEFIPRHIGYVNNYMVLYRPTIQAIMNSLI